MKLPRPKKPFRINILAVLAMACLITLVVLWRVPDIADTVVGMFLGGCIALAKDLLKADDHKPEEETE